MLNLGTKKLIGLALLWLAAGVPSALVITKSLIQ